MFQIFSIIKFILIKTIFIPVLYLLVRLNTFKIYNLLMSRISYFDSRLLITLNILQFLSQFYNIAHK